MIDISGMDLEEKLDAVTNVIIEEKDNDKVRRLAYQLGSCHKIFNFLKSKVRYRLEAKDILYRPMELLNRGVGDCEDLTAFMGSMCLALGYPVKLIIVRNGTRHIFPMVGIMDRWITFDATPHSGKIPSNYKVVFERIVYPNGSVYTKRHIMKPMPMSGLYISGRWVEVGMSEGVEPGDILKFEFKPKWYIPDFIEAWIYKKFVEFKHDNIEVLDVKRPKRRGDNFEVIVKVILPKTEGIGYIFTVAAIAAAVLGGGLFVFLTVNKVYKLVKEPIFKPLAAAILLFAAAYLIKQIKPREKAT